MNRMAIVSALLTLSACQPIPIKHEVNAESGCEQGNFKTHLEFVQCENDFVQQHFINTGWPDLDICLQSKEYSENLARMADSHKISWGAAMLRIDKKNKYLRAEQKRRDRMAAMSTAQQNQIRQTQYNDFIGALLINSGPSSTPIGLGRALGASSNGIAINQGVQPLDMDFPVRCRTTNYGMNNTLTTTCQ